MSQKKMTPYMWEKLFKSLGVPSGPEEKNKPVHYFESYTNANIIKARRLEKQGFRCLFLDPRGPAYMSPQEREARKWQREEGREGATIGNVHTLNSNI